MCISRRLEAEVELGCEPRHLDTEFCSHWIASCFGGLACTLVENGRLWLCFSFSLSSSPTWLFPQFPLLTSVLQLSALQVFIPEPCLLFQSFFLYLSGFSREKGAVGYKNTSYWCGFILNYRCWEVIHCGICNGNKKTRRVNSVWEAAAWCSGQKMQGMGFLGRY